MSRENVKRSIEVTTPSTGATWRPTSPNPYATTFPSEIAKLELADRAILHAFLKYESGGSNGSHGHRGGVP
jgi:hypothetical protein